MSSTRRGRGARRAAAIACRSRSPSRKEEWPGWRSWSSSPWPCSWCWSGSLPPNAPPFCSTTCSTSPTRRSRPSSRAAQPPAGSCWSGPVRRSLPDGGSSPHRGRSISGCWRPSCDVAGLVDLLAADAVLITDGGPEGREFRGIRNLRRPLEGAGHIAAFVVATSRRAVLDVEQRELNGQPALVFYRDGRPFAAVLLAVADGKIQRVFFHADPNHLRYLGPGPRH